MSALIGAWGPATLADNDLWTCLWSRGLTPMFARQCSALGHNKVLPREQGSHLCNRYEIQFLSPIGYTFLLPFSSYSDLASRERF